MWLVAFALIAGSASALGPRWEGGFSIPGTPAQQALDMMNERFPAGSQDADIKVILQSPDGSAITGQTEAVDAVISAVTTLPNVASVTSPFGTKTSSAISDDGSMAYISVHYAESASALHERDYADLRAAVKTALGSSGLAVAYTGMPNPSSAGDSTELTGLLISLVVLIVTFGSLWAAGMPLLTALIGVGTSMSLLTVASNSVNLSSTTPVLAEMLGLAVGIDYALFLVSRHRSQLANGMELRQSIAVATATAGSAVLFAGTTVVIALLGLSVVGIPFLSYMGIGAAIAVVIAMLVAVTLLPAVLSLIGRHLIPKPNSRTAKRETATESHTVGSRWVRRVTAKPMVTLLIAVPALLALALPAIGMRLALPDNGSAPAGSIERVGYDAIAKGWGAGVNGPLIVIADLSQTDIVDLEAKLSALENAFSSIPDIADATQAVPNPALDAAIMQITPSSGPDSIATERLVNTLRENAAAFAKTNGFSYQITGQTAMGIDISDELGAAIVPFAVVVVGLSLVLLMIVFRSIAVPVSATLGFLLSVGAAFGVTNAIFEHGVGAELLGLAKVGPIISFMPILVMAVLFGLAMDYQVFLVSRMRERFVATGDGVGSVRSGFSASARVVTAASLIMMSVFFSFVPGGSPVIQPLALALAVGVAIDALVVRMTIIPAFMALLGPAAWRLPHWLERLIPDVDIEGERVHGRLETLRWNAGADSAISIAAEDVRVAGLDLAPITLNAHAGNVVLLRADRELAAGLVLAALSGRAESSGLLVVGGHPLPYDGAALRHSSSLVVPGAGVMSGTVGSQLREQLRLERVPKALRTSTVVRETIELLGAAADIPVAHISAETPLAALSTDAAWLLDAAVAALAGSRLIAIDARELGQPASFVAALAGLAAANATLIVAVAPGDEAATAELAGAVAQAGREPVWLELCAATEAVPA